MRTSLSSAAAVRHGPCARPVGCIRHSTHGAHPPRPAVRFAVRVQIEAAAEMFHALGDPERLRLLVRLAARGACASELAEDEGEKITTVSARLKTLFSVRLVKRRREAKHVFYALADEHLLPDDLLRADPSRPCSPAWSGLRPPRHPSQRPR